MDFITWPYRLSHGHTDNPSEGACALAAISWLVHGEHNDHPACVSVVLGSLVRAINDAMPSVQRQHLLHYLERLSGSASPEHESVRLRILMLAAARVFAPLALEMAWRPNLAAARLRNLPDTVSYTRIGRTAAWGLGMYETPDDVAMFIPRNQLEKRSRDWVTALASHTVSHLKTAARAAAGKKIEHASMYAADVIKNTYYAARDIDKYCILPPPDPIGVVNDACLALLDAMLAAGPQGGAWSAVDVQTAAEAFRAAGGTDQSLFEVV